MLNELTTYDFLAPNRIVFGWGRRSEVGGFGRTLGRRAILVSGSRTLQTNGTLSAIESLLSESGVDCLPLATISHEPEVTDVDEAVAAMLQHDID